jgi:hypothetical protein
MQLIYIMFTNATSTFRFLCFKGGVKWRFSAADVTRMINDEDDNNDGDGDIECDRIQEACDAIASDRRNADIIICPPSTVDAVSDQ